MKIGYVEGLDSEEPSFGKFDETSDSSYLVDSTLLQKLRPFSITTAESLYDFATTDPAHVQQMFGMSENDFFDAMTGLNKLLKNQSPEFMKIVDTPKPNYGMGYPIPPEFELSKDQQPEDGCDEE